MIEQAKGILMARHAIDGERAFELLREQSQHRGRKLADIATAVVESHLLLPPMVQAPGTWPWPVVMPSPGGSSPDRGGFGCRRSRLEDRAVLEPMALANRAERR